MAACERRSVPHPKRGSAAQGWVPAPLRGALSLFSGPPTTGLRLWLRAGAPSRPLGTGRCLAAWPFGSEQATSTGGALSQIVRIL